MRACWCSAVTADTRHTAPSHGGPQPTARDGTSREGAGRGRAPGTEGGISGWCRRRPDLLTWAAGNRPSG